jgi:hypothetical protein
MTACMCDADGEFKGASSSAYAALVAMVLLYGGAIALIALSK